ncbi:MAG: TetR/AcrR family transcriptional regulator [Nannocystaceae bacterium]|nr:TetR/AcrR family transcriptional regulator [Nannocystaceae bacterium]
MKSPIDSRARFVETTATLLRRQGYHGTGLTQIVKDSGAPKGSLYFHFPGGKEELAEAALAYSSVHMHDDLHQIIAAATSPAEAIEAITTALADRLEASDFLDGCPVATVVLEAAAQLPGLRAVCSASYGRWQTLIETFLIRSGIAKEQAEPTANLVLCAIEGALLLSRAHADTTPLRLAGTQLAALLDGLRSPA